MLIVRNPIGSPTTLSAKQGEIFQGGEIVTQGSSPREVLQVLGTLGSFAADGVITVSGGVATLTSDTFTATNSGSTPLLWVGYSVSIVDGTHAANNGTFNIVSATANTISWKLSTAVATASGVVWTISRPIPNASTNLTLKDQIGNLFVNSQLGYAGNSVFATKNLTGVTTAVGLYLVDSGSTGYKKANGYGTQFGVWTGGFGGLDRTETLAGPGSWQSNGRLAAYRAGEFEVTLDTVEADLVPPTDNSPWVTAGGTLAPNAPLYVNLSTGRLTGVATAVSVGTFRGYNTRGGYVNTIPARNPLKPYDSLYSIVFEFSAV